MTLELVKWNESFELGLKEIDDQHHSLIDLINQIGQAIADHAELAVITELTGALEKYTVEHFTAEEDFMRAGNFPNLAEHKQEHDEFVARIAKEKAQAIESGGFSLDLMRFLRDWLINHIFRSDRKYANFTQGQTAQGQKPLLERFFKRFFRGNAE